MKRLCDLLTTRKAGADGLGKRHAFLLLCTQGGKTYAACAACPDAKDICCLRSLSWRGEQSDTSPLFDFVHAGLERRLASKSWPGSGAAGRRKDLPCSIKAALHQVRSKSVAGAGLLFYAQAHAVEVCR